ncbi:MAG TPA: nucleoside recognition domain-containing protein [Methylomirabilota bacterium]|nr:nucleoside recognition domain-containing protein [Methylomirabilota bacterium]
MLNYIWLFLILSAVLLGGATGKLKEVTDGAIKGAETAVTLSLGLIGIMALWLGIMRIAERAGIIQALARALRPLMRWLFPDVPVDHPAMGSMVLNIAANVLGLLNAATPFGLRAMRDLQTLNKTPGVASNAMCMFLAINTSSVQLLPVTAIAILAAAGSKSPTAIVGTALAATFFSTVAGVLSAKFLEKLRIFQASGTEASAQASSTTAAAEPNQSPLLEPVKTALTGIGKIILVLVALFFAGVLASVVWNPPAGAVTQDQGVFIRTVNAVSILAIPFLLSAIPLYALLRKVAVYEEFVEGAKEGFNVAIKIIPFLVAMLAAIGMFRNAGGIDLISRATRPVLDLIGFPHELLPMALMRPLSGSGSLGLFSDLVKQLGPDHLVSRMAATLYGSTETTFYVIAVYFGAVAIHRTRHAIAAGLIADLVGVIASVIICRYAFS